MPLILDCVPYFQEDDIWRLRYETLRDVVNGFVVVESDTTHAGHAKPITFCADGLDRVYFYAVSLPDGDTPGIPATRRREMMQRNQIVNAIEHHGGVPSDTILLISDCDEIPHPDAVAAIRERGVADGEIITFFQDLYYYNLNTRSPQPWPGTRAARWGDVAALSPHVVRCGLGQPDGHYPRHVGIRGGWHLSYFGGPEMVERKMKNFLHQELVTAENTDPATIAAAINAGRDVWGRADGGHGITLGAADLAALPAPIRDDPQRWGHFFHEEYQP